MSTNNPETNPEATSLTVKPPTNVEALALASPPAAVIADAQRAAQALKDVIERKPKPLKIGGETYLEFEDYQMLGKFYGVTAKVVSTHFIEYAKAKGFEARAVAIAADGRELSAAEAMCLNDENNWRDKPLFTLRSMAQTRAAAKSLRNVLAWVAVLAGYRPSNREEVEEALRPPKTVDFIKHLGNALLEYCNGDKRGAVEILKALTAKTELKQLTQDQARRAIEDFESQYLGPQPKME